MSPKRSVSARARWPNGIRPQRSVGATAVKIEKLLGVRYRAADHDQQPESRASAGGGCPSSACRPPETTSASSLTALPTAKSPPRRSSKPLPTPRRFMCAAAPWSRATTRERSSTSIPRAPAQPRRLRFHHGAGAGLPRRSWLYPPIPGRGSGPFPPASPQSAARTPHCPPRPRRDGNDRRLRPLVIALLIAYIANIS